MPSKSDATNPPTGGPTAGRDCLDNSFRFRERILYMDDTHNWKETDVKHFDLPTPLTKHSFSDNETIISTFLTAPHDMIAILAGGRSSILDWIHQISK
jgi:hypothetical protein